MKRRTRGKLFFKTSCKLFTLSDSRFQDELNIHSPGYVWCAS